MKLCILMLRNKIKLLHCCKNLNCAIVAISLIMRFIFSITNFVLHVRMKTTKTGVYIMTSLARRSLLPGKGKNRVCCSFKIFKEWSYSDCNFKISGVGI